MKTNSKFSFLNGFLKSLLLPCPPPVTFSQDKRVKQPMRCDLSNCALCTRHGQSLEYLAFFLPPVQEEVPPTEDGSSAKRKTTSRGWRSWKTEGKGQHVQLDQKWFIKGTYRQGWVSWVAAR